MFTTRSRRIRTGLALAVAVTVAAAGPAAAAENAAAAQPAKAHQLVLKGGKLPKKGAQSQQSIKTVKRALKKAGVKKAGAPKKTATKRMNRAICDIYYFWDGAVAVCLNVGGPTGFFNTVFVDSYFDNTGWIYYGWAYA
jgi:hypothetical protein